MALLAAAFKVQRCEILPEGGQAIAALCLGFTAKIFLFCKPNPLIVYLQQVHTWGQICGKYLGFCARERLGINFLTLVVINVGLVASRQGSGEFYCKMVVGGVGV